MTHSCRLVLVGSLHVSITVLLPVEEQKGESTSGGEFEINHRIGPAAAKLLRESGLLASAVKPSGPHNIVTKGDVLAAIAAGTKPPQKAAPKQACL